MTLLIHFLLFVIALPVTLACLYLGLLTLLSAKTARLPLQSHNIRFDILVPAHNESVVIVRTLKSLQELDWPAEAFRIIVIADNCTDNTAQLAREAGVRVVERIDQARLGKGYALEYGIAHSARDGFAQAVVVIDADTVVTPNLLVAYATRIEQGAEAVQAHYGVLNPDESWRTRLVTIAYGAFHAVRSRARERLRVSCGLRGNGMCLTHTLLRRHPFQIYSMTEDLEYGILLGLHGVRVYYADEASADAELISSGSGLSTQRQRWESGRLSVMRRYTVPLLTHGIRKRNAICIELTCDLLTMPLGYIALQIGGLLALASSAALFLPGMALWIVLALALIGVLLVHVLRGWQLTPLGPSALLDLLRAPFFILWKGYILLRDRHNRKWIRTDRGQQ